MEIKVQKKRGKRKRSPRPNKTGRKHPTASQKFKDLWADPVWRAKTMAGMRVYHDRQKANPNKHFRRGVPDGMRKAEADKLWAVAREQADKVIQMMKDDGQLPEVVIPDGDEAKAEAALKELCVIALGPTSLRERIAALKTVLDFTKKKPVTMIDQTVSTAEKWLKEVTGDLNAGRSKG